MTRIYPSHELASLLLQYTTRSTKIQDKQSLITVHDGVEEVRSPQSYKKTNIYCEPERIEYASGRISEARSSNEMRVLYNMAQQNSSSGHTEVFSGSSPHSHLLNPMHAE